MGKKKWGKLAAPVYPSDTAAGTWWQSYARLDGFPQLVNFVEFAKELRRTWP